MPTKPAPIERHPFPNGNKCLYLGPLPNGDNILVVIDYYSIYMEFKVIKSISFKTIVDEREEIFSKLGFPETITTDNGRKFNGVLFKSSSNTNGIRLMTTPLYSTQTNGEVDYINNSNSSAPVYSDADSFSQTTPIAVSNIPPFTFFILSSGIFDNCH